MNADAIKLPNLCRLHHSPTPNIRFCKTDPYVAQLLQGSADALLQAMKQGSESDTAVLQDSRCIIYLLYKPTELKERRAAT